MESDVSQYFSGILSLPFAVGTICPVARRCDRFASTIDAVSLPHLLFNRELERPYEVRSEVMM